MDSCRNKRCPLTLYYTAPLEEIGWSTPVIIDGGDIVQAGGVLNDNFTPYSAVYVFHLGKQPLSCKGYHPWLWFLLLTALLLIAAALFLHSRRRKTLAVKQEDVENTDVAESEQDSNDDLWLRITTLIEEQQMYLHEGLKVSDLADALGVPRRTVSECITSHSPSSSFAQFINHYRVRYAQQLLINNPEKKMATIGEESGFANENSFFRTFKAFTGMTPREWSQHMKNQEKD